MAEAASLPIVAAIKNNVPEAGRRVAARRAFLKKSGADIENETGGVIYAKLLYRIENGDKRVDELPYAKLRRLMYALEWTPEEFSEAVGLDLPTPSVPNADPYLPRHEVPMFETVAAGLASTPNEDEVTGHYPIDPSLTGLRGRSLENMVVVTVNGDSMASPDVKQRIPDGSLVVVELGARPREGDVVVAWIEERGVAVLKRYGIDHDAVLTSYKPGGPYFRATEYEIDIRGVARQLISRL